MDMNEAMAKAIRAERDIAGMTVRDLAKAAGVPERSLMRILQAERDIKVNQVAVLADALKLYPHELVEHAEQILERATRQRPRLIALPSDPNVPASVNDLDARKPRTQNLGEIAADAKEPTVLDVLAPGEDPQDI